MTIKIYDIAIIGAGVAGVFAAYKLAERKKANICLIDFGRPPNKRRKQLEGWLGCFPNSNSRLYVSNDLEKISKVANIKATSSADKIINLLLSNNGPVNETKNKEPSEVTKKHIKKLGYTLNLNNYIQWKPEHIHCLSREMSEKIVESNNIDLFFDTEVFNVEKKNDLFRIDSENGEILSKKILLCSGRSGWRFANKIFNDFGIIKENNFSYFGFRGEISSSCVKDWNECSCSVNKKDIEIGPFSWYGTVIPEDHEDLVISSWRSNEERWSSDKVSFSVISKKEYENKGMQQTERLGKLAYVLSDNRVGKIKIKEFLTTKNDILLIPEYKHIINEIKNVEKLIPNFIEKGYMHLPDIITYKHNITVKEDFSTEVDNLYVAGESAAISGLYSAALSGIIAASTI